MTVAAAVIEALLLLFLPGLLLALVPGPRDRAPGRTPGEILFLGVFLSICQSSVLGLALAYLGYFSVPVLALLNAAVCLILILIGRARVRWRPADFLPRRLRDWALPGILLIAGVLYSRPIHYVFGGLDPGVYVATGVNLARTGSLRVQDPVLAGFSPRETLRFSRRHSHGYLEKYPGFRLCPRRPGELLPQFYHLYPLWLAVFYHWGGLAFVFYLNPLLGLLSLLAIYFALRRLWDWRVGLLALFPLALNLSQIWQVRLPTAETFSQLFFFGSLLLLASYLETGGRRCGALAGGALGCFFISHISAALLLAPLAVFFYRRWFLRFRPGDFWLLVPLGAGLALSLFPHLFFGTRYAALALNQFSRSGLLLLPAGAGLLAALAARACSRPTREFLGRLFSSTPARALLALAAAGALFFGFFLRPGLASENPELTNLVELSWFLTPLGAALASLALLGMILREKSPARWYFLLALLTFGGVFLWQQMIHFNYMWAVRRYSVLLVPGGLILAAVFLERLRRWPLGRAASGLLLAVLALQTALVSRPVWRHREFRWALDFLSELERELVAPLPVLVGGSSVDKIPTMVHLILNRRVLPLYRNDPAEIVGGAAALSRVCPGDGSFYYLADGPFPEETGLEAEFLREIRFRSFILERTWDRVPSLVLEDAAPDANFDVFVYRFRLPPEPSSTNFTD